MPPHHKKRKPLLSSTRSHRLSHPSTSTFPSHPPSSSTSTSTSLLPSTQARTLIRQHHVLQKRLAAARVTHDLSLVAALEAQITTLGGLARYQRASLAGQAKTRGGDSSDVLVRWIREMMDEGGRRGGGEANGREGKVGRQETEGGKARRHKCEQGWRMLEVGALRVDNAAARSGIFAHVERIDLHAQEKGILQQDFMQRPLPPAAKNDEEGEGEDEERFDVVSLSLVLNYVGDPAARGEMLRRVERFLRKRKRRKLPEKKGARHGVVNGVQDDDDDDGRRTDTSTSSPSSSSIFPGLFLVLPAPCVTNSRYLDEDRLEAMMRGLGYVKAKRKLSLKLVYYFWRWEGWRRGRERREGERGRGYSGEDTDTDAEGEDEGKGGQELGRGRGRGRGRERERGQDSEEEDEQEHESVGQGEKGISKFSFSSQPRSQSQSRNQIRWSKIELPHRKGGKRNNFAVVFK